MFPDSKPPLKDYESSPGSNDQKSLGGMSSAITSVNLHKYFGKVPKYIEKYRNEKELELMMQRDYEAQPKIPPGMKLLSDEERLKLMADLEDTKWDITRKLNSLPIT